VTLKDLIEQQRAQMAAKLDTRNGIADELAKLRDEATTDEAKVADLRKQKDDLDAELDAMDARVKDLEAELARDEAADRLAREVHPTGASREGQAQVRVGAEPRTYSPETDKRGERFLRDVGRAFLGDWDAQARLQRHMVEERVERAAYFGGIEERAAGTGAFAGLTVPQYLTDLYAPNAKAARPLADACTHHDLPASGMTVNLSLITTGTSAALQASENTAVSETNIDDTLLTINVQTNAGQQTLSRQAIERGTGVEGAMLDDLFRSYATTLDNTLINQATTGLSAVAGATATYVDATPTVAEFYPKVLQALSLSEAALLDQDQNDYFSLMHSRRWYWLGNAIGSTWPFVQQPGIPAQMGITNLATAYGSGARGVLPNGTPVVVDNNIATNKGGGTEDEVFVCARRECHLWEDPDAPLLIRAEQPAAASLGVLFVVYGYFAYTFNRYSGGQQKISGTGLAAPTFTGV